MRALEWLTGASLDRVDSDLATGRLTLRTGAGALVAEGVEASTVLGPWDGTAGVLEWARVVEETDARVFVELRVLFGEVPRVYRLVARVLHERPNG